MRRWLVRHEVLVLILLGVVVLRVPTLLEPYWYGDEGIYLTVGQALRRGSQLYAQIHDNKPPFLYLVTAAVDGYQFWFKFVTLVVNVATVALFWQLAKKWLVSPSWGMWATGLFALLTNLPVLEGNVANAELYFLPLTIGAFYWLYSNQSAFAGGVLLGLAALFKMPAILEGAIWPVFWLASGERQGWKKTVGLIGGAGLPLVVSGAYFWGQGTLSNYLVATGLHNIPYLASWQAPVSMAVRVGVAALVIGALVWWRKTISHKMLLLGLWWVVTLFAALLSGRPYPHYLLQMTPAIGLGIVMLFAGKGRQGSLLALLVALALASVLAFKFYHYPILGYYTNFWQFVVGQKSQWEYFDALAGGTSRNYQISRLVVNGSSPQDKIFVWGDQPMIYALSRRQPVGRYTAKYHILDFGAQAETMTILNRALPRYIVSFGQEEALPGLASLLATKYRLEKELLPARVYRLYNGNL